MKEMLQKTMDSLSEHIAVLDSQSTIVFVNQAWKRFADDNGLVSPDYGVGHQYIQVCEKAQDAWSEDAMNLADQLKKVLSGEVESYTMEYPCHSVTENRWFRMNINGFTMNNARWAVIAHENITEIKETTLSLICSENKLKGIIASIPDPMFMLDRSLTVVWSNGPARDTFGPGLENKECIMAYGGKGALCDNCIVQKTFADGQVHAQEYSHINIQGNIRVYVCRTSVTGYDQDGTPSHVMEIMHDVTEERAAEKQIRRLSQAVEYSPVSVVITDVNGIIEYVNPKFTEVTGYTAEEALGQNSKILSSGSLSKDYYETLWSTITSGRVWQGEFPNVKKNGDLYWESASISPIFNKDREIMYFVAVKEDITELKAMIRELKAAKLAAESATKAKSDFLATMSHEIRTPMNAILGMSQIVLGSGLTQPQHNHVSTIYSAAEALLSIINDILDFSKVEAGKLTINKQEFQFGTVIEKIINVLKFTAEEKNLRLIYCFRHPIPLFLLGDPLRVSQVIMNLVSNALKYTDAGNVEVTTDVVEEKDGRIMLSLTVRDTGIGITPDQMGMLFQPFIQLDSSTTRRHGGTGLGLALVKLMVEVMDGEITVQSSPGTGSVFSVRLPFIKGSSTKIPSLPVDKLSGLSALIIEPHTGEGEALKTNFESLGIQTTRVVSPEQCLEVITSGSNHGGWDLFVLNHDLLNTKGQSLASLVKTARRSDNKVCFLIRTSRTEMVSVSGWQRLCEEVSGKMAIIELPVTPINLIKTLVNLLDNRESDLSPRWCDNTVNPVNDALPGLAEKKVMVVDDDAVNREIVIAFLEKTGVRLYQAMDGRSAVDMVAREQFHLVFMDVEMPLMDGYEATRRIRDLDVPWSSSIPIVALTGHALAEFREKCLASGMNDYLEKPLKQDRIQEMLFRWIRPEGSTQGSVCQNEHIQVKAGLSYVSGKVPMYSKMLRIFIDTYAGAARDISRAWENRDLDTARHLVHKLKSIASMIGADKLARIVITLETLFNYGKNETEDVTCPGNGCLQEIQQELAAFSWELSQVIHAAEKLLSTLNIQSPALDSKNPVPDNTPGIDDRDEQLSRLLEFIIKHQPLESCSILDRMALKTRDEDLRNQFKHLKLLIERYRFNEAEEKLKVMVKEAGSGHD